MAQDLVVIEAPGKRAGLSDVLWRAGYRDFEVVATAGHIASNPSGLRPLGITSSYRETAYRIREDRVAACERIREFFTQEEIFVEKRTKHKGMTELNIAPLIRSLTLTEGEGVILADAVVAAQDPGLNPALIGAAVARHLPEIAPDFVRVRRKEVYDAEMNVFR